jgi:hypothetical protein
MTLKEEISAVQPSIREALNQIAFQTGIPYVLGSCSGGVISMYEYCTFTAPGHEPLVLGVTLQKVNEKVLLVLDLVEEESGYIHWKVNLDELPEGGIPKLADTVMLADTVIVNLLKKILATEPKSEEPKKQILTKLVR